MSESKAEYIVAGLPDMSGEQALAVAIESIDTLCAMMSSLADLFEQGVLTISAAWDKRNELIQARTVLANFRKVEPE